MELSVFYDHIRDAAQQAGKSTAEIMRYCRSCGISGVEIHFSCLEACKETICAELADSGMKISCMYEWFDYAKDADTARGKKMIDAAADMQVHRILVIPGVLEAWEAAELNACCGDYATAEQYMNHSAGICGIQQALSELVAYAAPKGVLVTLEDYDGFEQPFARMNQLLWFMQHVPGLRYTLDMGNFAFSDEDVVAAAEVLAPYIVHVHCKDRRESPYAKGKFCKGLGQCAAGEGYLPIASLVKRLKMRGYDGYLAIEHFGVPDQLAHIGKSAAFLRQAWDTASILQP